MGPTMKDPGDEPFLKVLRPLVETYFAFVGKDQPHIRSLGLTLSQFDVIATLGGYKGVDLQTALGENVGHQGNVDRRS